MQFHRPVLGNKNIFTSSFPCYRFVLTDETTESGCNSDKNTSTVKCVKHIFPGFDKLSLPV